MMREHLPKIILLTIYPCFLWAGSAFLDTIPDTREVFGNVKQRFAKLTEAANIYDSMRGTAFRGELPKEMTTEAEALNGYLNYLAVAYEGVAQDSIDGYMAAITSSAKESKASMLAIALPEIVHSDFKIAKYLRWVIGPTLRGSTFQEVKDDIRRKLSFPFPGVTAQAHDLWAAILVNSCQLLDLKVTSRAPVAISLSFSRDTLPIIYAYNPALAEAARRRAVSAVVAVAGAGGKTLPASERETDSLLVKGKLTAGGGVDPAAAAAATGSANVALLRHEERSPPYKCKACIML